MKGFAKTLISVMIGLGGMTSVAMLAMLLLCCMPAPLCGIVCLMIVSPILLYANVKKAPKGSYRSFCNLVGGALTVPMLYLLIYSGIGGCVCIGFWICNGAPSLALYRYILLCVLALTLLTVLCGMANAARVRVVRYTISHPVSRPVRLALFSDLHLGPFCTVSHVKRIVSNIQKESPDLVLFAGDLVDLDLPCKEKQSKIAPLLESLGGIIACEGNHDLHTRGSYEKDTFLCKAGVHLLLDEARTDPKTSLKIACQQSFRRKRAPLAAFATGADILLDHEPKNASEACTYGIPLVLCGHTHRGQTFPGNILRRFTTPFFYGKKNCGDSTVITTAGCGSTGLAMRFLITNEIVIINLVPSTSKEEST